MADWAEATPENICSRPWQSGGACYNPRRSAIILNGKLNGSSGQVSCRNRQKIRRVTLLAGMASIHRRPSIFFHEASESGIV